jgi:outer membrane protein TolC
MLAAAALLQQAAAAPSAPPPPTTAPTVVLTFEAFAAQVLANHPVARAASLARDQAEQGVRLARGNFDPTVSATWDRKAKSGLDSYNDLEAELKVPTLPGVDLKLGYARGVGPTINPQLGTANAGQLSLGVSLPLGQRILTDERRLALTQARASLDGAEADRQGAVNKLLLSAAKDYADWYEASQALTVRLEGLRLADFRLNAIRTRWENGEAPAIDTLEARLEVQRRQAQLVEAQQALFRARLVAEAYLWDDRGLPVPLGAATVPSTAGFAMAALPDSTRERIWLEAAAAAHPDLRKIEATLRRLEAQRTFVGQQLLPFAALDVAALADGDKRDALFDSGEYDANYKLGATFKSPLLFLKERGRWSQVSQALDQQRTLRAQLRRQIANEVRIASNDIRAVTSLQDLQGVTVSQARQLLQGEMRRFENGESSLLIVNLRERLLLDEQLKLASLQAKSLSARAALGAAIGLPGRLP